MAGVNQYAYVMNSPLNFNDPWGTTPNGVSNTIGSAFPAGSYGAQWNSGVSLGLQPVINGYANTLMATAGTGLLTAAIASVPAALATSSNFWAAIGIAGSQGDAENIALGGPASKAESVADAAFAAGKRSGAAAELRVGDNVFTGTSGEMVPHNSEVTGALMGTPAAERAAWHGGCAEIVCLDKAMNAGIDPAGGTIRTVNIGVSGAGHNTEKAICPSCNDILNFFGVKK